VQHFEGIAVEGTDYLALILTDSNSRRGRQESLRSKAALL
jgi:hypothetical protein